MNRRSALISMLLAASCVLALAQSGMVSKERPGSPQMHWSFIEELPGDCKGGWCMLAMFDPQHGLLHGHSRLWRTLDAGTRWVEHPLPEAGSGSPIQIEFTDSQSGWMISDAEHLYRTSDGGAQWKSVPVPKLDGEIATAWMFPGTGRALLGAAVYGASRTPVGPNYALRKSVSGWDILHPVVYETRDGGASWSRRDLPDCAFVLRSIRFMDAEHGYALGDGCLYYTESGGETWAVARFRRGTTARSGFPPDSANPIAYFLDSMHGWLSLEMPSAGVVYQTTDGGKNWIEVGRAKGRSFDELRFLSQTLGFGVVKQSELYQTLDGGQTWARVETKLRVRDVFFLNQNVGWVLSDSALHRILLESSRSPQPKRRDAFQ